VPTPSAIPLSGGFRRRHDRSRRSKAHAAIDDGHQCGAGPSTRAVSNLRAAVTCCSRCSQPTPGGDGPVALLSQEDKKAAATIVSLRSNGRPRRSCAFTPREKRRPGRQKRSSARDGDRTALVVHGRRSRRRQRWSRALIVPTATRKSSCAGRSPDEDDVNEIEEVVLGAGDPAGVGYERDETEGESAVEGRRSKAKGAATAAEARTFSYITCEDERGGVDRKVAGYTDPASSCRPASTASTAQAVHARFRLEALGMDR
jgi:hypothetical protein